MTAEVDSETQKYLRELDSVRAPPDLYDIHSEAAISLNSRPPTLISNDFRQKLHKINVNHQKRISDDSQPSTKTVTFSPEGPKTLKTEMLKFGEKAEIKKVESENLRQSVLKATRPLNPWAETQKSSQRSVRSPLNVQTPDQLSSGHPSLSPTSPLSNSATSTSSNGSCGSSQKWKPKIDGTFSAKLVNTEPESKEKTIVRTYRPNSNSSMNQKTKNNFYLRSGSLFLDPSDEKKSNFGKSSTKNSERETITKDLRFLDEIESENQKRMEELNDVYGRRKTDSETTKRIEDFSPGYDSYSSRKNGFENSKKIEDFSPGYDSYSNQKEGLKNQKKIGHFLEDYDSYSSHKNGFENSKKIEDFSGGYDSYSSHKNGFENQNLMDDLSDSLKRQKLGSPGRIIGNCGKCFEPVFDNNQVTYALDSFFHDQCFFCVSCKKSLRGRKFYRHGEKNFCEEDYFLNGLTDNCTRCFSCERPITDMVLQALGKSFHPVCFRCHHCGQCLDGVPFAVDGDSKVFCMEDYQNLFSPNCAVCHKPIKASNDYGQIVRVVAMEKEFHIDCYRCEGCGMQLTNESDKQCYPLNDHLLCRRCNLEWARIGAPVTDC